MAMYIIFLVAQVIFLISLKSKVNQRVYPWIYIVIGALQFGTAYCWYGEAKYIGPLLILAGVGWTLIGSYWLYQKSNRQSGKV